MDGMMYFQCQQAAWREDVALEHPGVRFWLHEMDNRFHEKTDIFSQYRHNLREYTHRNLTVQSDAINAYAAVLGAQRLMSFIGNVGIPVSGMHTNFMLVDALPLRSWDKPTRRVSLLVLGRLGRPSVRTVAILRLS